MPGVVVTTAVRTGPSVANVTPSATFFIVGRTERGPSDEAVLVTSLADYEEQFGSYVAYGVVHQQMQTYFEEGGSQAYVARVVGASATAGTASLLNSSDTAAITLSANGAGSWSSNLDAEVVAAGAGFAVKLYLNDILVYNSGECSSSIVAVNKINTSSLASAYVSAAVGAGGGNPVTGGGIETFSTGSDAVTPTTSEYTTALNLFTDTLGAGAVAIPGQYGSTIWDALISHCNTTNRIALCAFEEDATSAEVISDTAAYADASNSEHAAFFFPWIQIERDANVLAYISPEGYVAAKRALAQNSDGPWRPYAGLMSEASYVLGLKTGISKATSDDLDEGRVNGLRVINGRVRIYGARTASNDEINFRYITAQEMLNYVVVQAQAQLEDLVFSTIDGRQTLFANVKSRLINLLDPIRVNGGLYEAFDTTGRRIDYGYSVVVNEAINPVSQLAGGLIRAKVGIRVSSVGDQIEIAVTKSNLTASVV
jgi:hypothetical protein